MERLCSVHNYIYIYNDGYWIHINTINKTSKMLYGDAGDYLLFCITTALTDIITQYVSDGGNNYDELIKACETFYNIESLYSWVFDFQVF